MRQKNDGRGRMGGRQKGTPNRVTRDLREWVARLIDANRGQLEDDLQALAPKERLDVIEKFMQYVLPRRQAVRADLSVDELSDDQIDAIVKRLADGLEGEGE